MIIGKKRIKLHDYNIILRTSNYEYIYSLLAIIVGRIYYGYGLEGHAGDIHYIGLFCDLLTYYNK